MKKIVKFIPLMFAPLVLSSCSVLSDTVGNVLGGLTNLVNPTTDNNSSSNNSSSNGSASSQSGNSSSNNSSSSSSSSSQTPSGSVTISQTNATITVGETVTLTATASDNSTISWSSSNSSVATVNKGVVTGKAAGSATITASATINGQKISKTCSITVEPKQNNKAEWTIMIYMCGADLESVNGLASSDIDEILKVSGQPDDVNIIIETGGASSWQSGHSYTISSSKLERWHVENKSLVKDASLTYAGMGKTTTFQSFLEWGLTEYPADKTGVIMWNHGGGMYGVCYDEKDGDDSLLNNEVKTALSNTFTKLNRTEKLEFIGYDACLMSVQDVAEFNSEYFNYQISAEESESGYGWDYDNWVDDLYAKKTTDNILKAIVDSFIDDNGGANITSYQGYTADQTLSYLNLAYMSEYKAAWEDIATQLKNKLTSSNKSTFNNAIKNNVKHFAGTDYDYFCTFDAYDFADKLGNNSSFSNYRVDASYITAYKNAFAKLVEYSVAQKGAGNAKGLCMYWPNSSSYSNVGTYYATSQTNFTNWRSVCATFGTYRS